MPPRPRRSRTPGPRGFRGACGGLRRRVRLRTGIRRAPVFRVRVLRVLRVARGLVSRLRLRLRGVGLRTGIRKVLVLRVRLVLRLRRVRPRTVTRRRPVVAPGRLSRRVCPALPVLRGPRRAPGTSPMSPRASWRLLRAGRRSGDRPRRLRRVPRGCPVRRRGTRIRRPLPVRRGVGMCPPSSCRRRVSRGLRDREHRSPRAHRSLLVVRRLRLRPGLRVCRMRPAARDSRVQRARHRLLVARVRLSSRMRRVAPVFRGRPVLRVLPAHRSLLVPQVCHGPRLEPCITRRPCCPHPRRAAPAFLLRRKRPALLAPQGPLEPRAFPRRLRVLRNRCRPARCRPRPRVPYRPRVRCLRPGSRRQGSLRPGSRCRDSPHLDRPCQGSLRPGSRCRDSPPRFRPRPVGPGPVSPRPTAIPSRRSPPSVPGIRPSFATVRRTGRSSS